LSKGGAGEIDRILRILDRAETKGTNINTEVIRKVIETFENDDGSIRADRNRYPLALNPKKLESEFQSLLAQKTPSLAKLRKLRTQADAGARSSALLNEKLGDSLEGVADRIRKEITLRETASELRREGVIWSKIGDSFRRTSPVDFESAGNPPTQIKGISKVFKKIPQWENSEYGNRFAKEKDTLLKDAIIHEIATGVTPPGRNEEYIFRSGTFKNLETGNQSPWEDNGLYRRTVGKTFEQVNIEDLPADVREFFDL